MSVPIQDAASVVLLRNGVDGLEVLMGRRNSKTKFSAGAWVFPGGAVDSADQQAIAHCRSVDAEQANGRFQDAAALRFYLAAAREMYEEAGVWLFDAQAPQVTDSLRKDLHNGRITLDQLFHQHDRRCALNQLHYFDFWTTPPLQPRRYRTRFFAALMPADQQPEADGVELLEVQWFRPEAMLRRYAQQQASLIFPTIKQLQRLSDYRSAEDAWDAIKQVHEVNEIRTRHRIIDGRSLEILMPGEPGYDELPAW